MNSAPFLSSSSFSSNSVPYALNPFLPLVSASVVGAQHAAPLLASPQMSAQIPEWCRALPRPEYKSLPRVLPDDPWFEIYKVAPGVFAIYEPHQAEEVISYLIVGQKQAVLFDTGMGIGDIRKLTAKLTTPPAVVLTPPTNAHTLPAHGTSTSLPHTPPHF